MGVLTWSFPDSFEGWTFTDEDSSGGGAATRSHVAGAIRTNITGPAGAGVNGEGDHLSPSLNIVSANGDTARLDFGAPSDAQDTTFVIRATYTDETNEQTQVTTTTSGNITLTITQNKTIDFLTVTIGRTGGGPWNFTADVLEVKLTTAGSSDPTAGLLRTPFSFIQDEGAGAGGGAGGGAGNIACISKNGLYVYIAAFNNLGFPTLIRMPAALTGDGIVAFEPGAGSRIGCECAQFNEDHVWVAGQFDGTNTVEKSEDNGTSFTVKDDGTFGVIRAIHVGPDSDDRIIIFDGDNNDIIETIDDGVTWTTINAATSVLLNSIARFDQSVEEIATVNEAGATDGAYYSPNSGVNLQDIQAAPYPNEDGTKVIAN